MTITPEDLILLIMIGCVVIAVIIFLTACTKPIPQPSPTPLKNRPTSWLVTRAEEYMNELKQLDEITESIELANGDKTHQNLLIKEYERIQHNIAQSIKFDYQNIQRILDERFCKIKVDIHHKQKETKNHGDHK